MTRLITLAILVGLSNSGSAQAVIVDGTSSFGWTSSQGLNWAENRTGRGGGLFHVFRSHGSSNNSFQEWWWYRVNGVNTREYALSNEAAAPMVNGNTMQLSYLEPEGFSSTLVYTITNLGGTTLVTGSNLVRNEGTVPLSMEFYHYFDPQIQGNTFNYASLIAPTPDVRMRVYDSSVLLVGHYGATDAFAYQAAPFGSLRVQLSDDATTDLDNTGFPWSIANFTAAVQWRLSLDPGESVELETTRLLVPEPLSLFALAGGLALLLRRRRTA